MTFFHEAQDFLLPMGLVMAGQLPEVFALRMLQGLTGPREGCPGLEARAGGGLLPLLLLRAADGQALPLRLQAMDVFLEPGQRLEPCAPLTQPRRERRMPRIIDAFRLQPRQRVAARLPLGMPQGRHLPCQGLGPAQRRRMPGPGLLRLRSGLLQAGSHRPLVLHRGQPGPVQWVEPHRRLRAQQALHVGVPCGPGSVRIAYLPVRLGHAFPRALHGHQPVSLAPGGRTPLAQHLHLLVQHRGLLHQPVALRGVQQRDAAGPGACGFQRRPGLPRAFEWTRCEIFP